MKRRVIWLSCLGVALILLGFGLLGNYADANPVPVPDDYKIYEFSPLYPWTAANVLLEDQFGETFHPSLALEKFSTPLGYWPGIAHLSWWTIDDPQPTRQVGVWDQFGYWNIWTIKDGRYLLAPALKDTGGDPPEENHYKCYEVIQGPTMNTTLRLVDQYDDVTVTVLTAKFLCNPVQKTHGGHVYPVIDSSFHLTVYEVENTTLYNIPVGIVDQFVDLGTIGYLHENLYLAVGAVKEYPIAIEESTWGRIKALYKNENE
jgi:hypothetical protein